MTGAWENSTKTGQHWIKTPWNGTNTSFQKLHFISSEINMYHNVSHLKNRNGGIIFTAKFNSHLCLIHLKIELSSCQLTKVNGGYRRSTLEVKSGNSLIEWSVKRELSAHYVHDMLDNEQCSIEHPLKIYIYRWMIKFLKLNFFNMSCKTLKKIWERKRKCKEGGHDMLIASPPLKNWDKKNYIFCWKFMH